MARLRDSQPKPLDLGVLELTADSGKRVTRAFVNITSFGIGGLTDRIVNSSPKWMGGRAAFFVGTLRAMASYRNLPVVVKVDGKSCLEGPILNVAIANGRYFGGGMMIAPEADPSDGQFDIVALYDLTRAQGIGLAYKIYKGSHLGSPGVRVARGSVIEAEPALPWGEVLIDMDGETPGRLPLKASVAKSGAPHPCLKGSGRCFVPGLHQARRRGGSLDGLGGARAAHRVPEHVDAETEQGKAGPLRGSERAVAHIGAVDIARAQEIERETRRRIGDRHDGDVEAPRSGLFA